MKLGIPIKLWKPFRMQEDWIKVNNGDCVVFDQRVYHSPNDYKGEKIALYLSYGLDNEHSKNHLTYYREKRKDLGYLQKIPDDLKNLLLEENVFLDS